MSTEEQIYRKFARGLEEWSRTDKAPEAGNQDIRYYLELQRERLRSRNLKMEYQLSLRGEHLDHIHSATYRDQVYTNVMTGSSYLQKTTFFRDGKVLYEKEEPQRLFQTITDMEQQRPEETYCCPNCGAASLIGALLEGCPYCHTRFLMSDLFPKVTSFCFVHDFFMNNKEFKVKTLKWVLGGILFVFLLSLPMVLDMGLAALPLCLVISIPVGAFLGYLLMSFSMLFHLVGAAAREVVRLPNVAGTKKKIERLVKSFDPSFTFEHFSGRIVNLLKIMIYAEDASNVPVYDGQGEIPDFSDIVESVYGGSMGLNRGWVRDGYCYLDLDVYMSDIYDRKRIERKNDMFRILVCKSTGKQANLGFSIKKVQCAGCGGSFDATRQRICPYCGNAYHLSEDDWVVLSVKKSLF